MPRGAQVNTGSVFFCLLFGYRLWHSHVFFIYFFLNLQPQRSLWDGNCSLRMKTLSCVFNCGVLWDVHTWPCLQEQPLSHTDAHTLAALCLALMRMELHFAAVIVDVDFPPLSLKIRFARPRGLPIVLSASPLCMTALCRRCSTKQPHWNAANAPPLWHKKHFIDTLFLHSSEYNQRYLSGLGSWLIQWLYTHKYTDAHRILSSTPLNVAREKALCCIGMKVAVSCIERIHWKWVVFMSVLWSEKGCNGVFWSLPPVLSCCSVNYNLVLCGQDPFVSVIADSGERLPVHASIKEN